MFHQKHAHTKGIDSLTQDAATWTEHRIDLYYKLTHQLSMVPSDLYTLRICSFPVINNKNTVYEM